MLSHICLSIALAALAVSDPMPSSGDRPLVVTGDAEYARFLERATTPVSSGSGPYPAIMGTEDTLPGHVIYRPADLDAMGGRRAPVYIFGNGGCSRDGASARLHLMEIASHGYIVIASGDVMSAPGALVPPPPFLRHFNQTRTEQMIEAIDWAGTRAQNPDSPYHDVIDASAIAVSGHSCGGLQALEAATDPRVSTVIVMYSGIYNDERPGRSGIALPKSHLERIAVPMLYVLGGPEDIAYENGMDDFRRIGHVPVAVASHDVGHGGTFWDENGGTATRLVLDWLEWSVRGDTARGGHFAGADCLHCKDPHWTIAADNWD